MTAGVVERGTRYRFERKLASGGMADLFVAEAVAAGGVRKQVAVKRIQPRHAADAEFTEMFVREARLASTLQHPNIVQTYDVLQVRGEYFIVMELLEGCDLQRFRKRVAASGIPFRASHALHVIDRVLSALHYAHERTDPNGVPLGITHRDVAPDNIFLSVQGSVKLLDFGIAKAQTHLDRGSSSGLIKGKVSYMAPEQCQNSEIDRRADLYAVGVSMYRLLSGELPLKGQNAYDAMRAVIHDQPRDLAELVPELPAALCRLVMRALSKDPADRPQTAREMQTELLEIIKANQYFVTELEFTGLVEDVFHRSPPVQPDAGLTEDLPADLVIGSEVPPQQSDRAAPGVVVSTDAATLERIEGALVLRLRGSIDERMPWQAILPHLVGDVLIDTEHVVRISSFGIRGLLALFERGRGRANFHHVRVSVPFLQQASMVRALLGEGRVLSYFLPYTDPKTGSEFLHLVQGPRGTAVLESRVPPEVPCPGAPERLGRFDEDPDALLCFAGAYDPIAPPNVRAAVAALDGDGARPIEKHVDGRGTRIRVRRPLNNELRWGRLLRGVEGALALDFEQVPHWDDDGLADLRDGISGVRNELTRLDLVGLPQDLYEKVSRWPQIANLVGEDAIRLSMVCRVCETPRQVLAARPAYESLWSSGVWSELACPRCDGELVPARPLPAMRGSVVTPPPPPAAPSRPASVPPPVSAPQRQAPPSRPAQPAPPERPRAAPYAQAAPLESSFHSGFVWMLVLAMLAVGCSLVLLVLAFGWSLT